MRLIPYLMVGGQTHEAFKFYRDALAGEIEGMISHGASPMCDQMPPEGRGRIMLVCCV